MCKEKNKRGKEMEREGVKHRDMEREGVKHRDEGDDAGIRKSFMAHLYQVVFSPGGCSNISDGSE